MLSGVRLTTVKLGNAWLKPLPLRNRNRQAQLQNAAFLVRNGISVRKRVWPSISPSKLSPHWSQLDLETVENTRSTAYRGCKANDIAIFVDLRGPCAKFSRFVASLLHHQRSSFVSELCVCHHVHSSHLLFIHYELGSARVALQGSRSRPHHLRIPPVPAPERIAIVETELEQAFSSTAHTAAAGAADTGMYNLNRFDIITID